MTRINSRSKGNKNERDLAQLFKKWTGKEFARTPSSGGLSWKTTNAKGDIVCTTEGHYFPFCIEAKNYKDINFEHLLYSKKSKIFEFWAQATKDAKKANKVPLLFMRYNRMPKDLHFIVMYQDFAKKIHHLLPLETITLRYHNYLTEVALMIFNSNHFFEIPYKETKKIAKEHIGYGKKK